MFEIIENELADVVLDDILLTYKQKNLMGKQKKMKLKKEYYEKLIKANDIHTWALKNNSVRFGISKEQGIRFTYYNNGNYIHLYKENDDDEFINNIIEMSFGGGIYTQSDIDIYCYKNKIDTISIDDLIINIKNLINY